MTTEEYAAALQDAILAEREACAQHIERVFCDGSAPELLTAAYQAVANSIRARDPAEAACDAIADQFHHFRLLPD